jgi:ATP-dependent DNA helicase RecG
LRDEELIEKARTAAQDLIATSLDLTSYPALKKELNAMAHNMAVDYLDKG